MNHRDYLIICQNLNIEQTDIRKSYYNTKITQYSKNQPKRLAVLELWFTSYATPFWYDVNVFSEICGKIGILTFDKVENKLIELHTMLALHAFDYQFKNCEKHKNGSLKLFKHNTGNTLVYRTGCGDFIDFYSRKKLDIPEQCFSDYVRAVSKEGLFIPVIKSDNVGKRK